MLVYQRVSQLTKLKVIILGEHMARGRFSFSDGLLLVGKYSQQSLNLRKPAAQFIFHGPPICPLLQHRFLHCIQQWMVSAVEQM